MKKDIQNCDITVLIISDDDADIAAVKKYLGKTMDISCHIRHCSNFLQSLSLFKKEGSSGIDIVLLDLAMMALQAPQEIFQRLKDVVGDTPIIVFTDHQEHELALHVVEEGASTSITKGMFSADPYKLRDAIDFSLARNKLLRKTEQHIKADLKKAKKEAALALQKEKEKATSRLKEKDEIIHWMGGGYSVKKPSRKS